MKRTAFTLVELILVVTILGILAALVLPVFQDHVVSAKESAAKSNLGTMRSQIELYKLQHGGYPPGYVSGNGTTIDIILLQFTATSTESGSVSPSTVPTALHPYGPYLKKIPPNPFNGKSDLNLLPDGALFSANATGDFGWLYRKDTGEIALDWTGTDKSGVAYYDY